MNGTHSLISSYAGDAQIRRLLDEMQVGTFIAAVRVSIRTRAAGGGGVVAAVGILIVLAGALSTFSYITLGGYILVLTGFVALGAVMIRDGVTPVTDVDGTAPTF